MINHLNGNGRKDDSGEGQGGDVLGDNVLGKDEDRLIRKIQKNADRKSADILIRRYYDEIYIYAYRQIGNKENAMDVTQDIFMSVLKSINSYDRKKSSFRTWLYRVSTNKIIDYRRRQNGTKGQAVLLENDFYISEDFESQIEERELVDEVEKYISGFDCAHQEVFRLKLFGGYTLKEISDILKLPESTVKTRYYRILKSVRKEFERDV